MGYYSHVSGEIQIKPPLTHKEYMEHEDWFTEAHDRSYDRVLPEKYGKNRWFNVNFGVDSNHKDTDFGRLVSKTVYSMIPYTDDEAKFYDLENSVQAIIDAYPDHEYTGYFHVEGEESGDIWRLYVRDGKTLRVEAEFRWPEGFEE